MPKRFIPHSTIYHSPQSARNATRTADRGTSTARIASSQGPATGNKARATPPREARSARSTRSRRPAIGSKTSDTRLSTFSRRATTMLLLAVVAMVVMPGSVAWVTHNRTLPPVTIWTSRYDGHTMVHVYKSDTSQVVTIPMSDYIINVLAAELPSNAPTAALQAASIVARTYVIDQQHIRSAHGTAGSNLAFTHGADVSDNAAYDLPWMTVAAQQATYKNAYLWVVARYRSAVLKTDGQILVKHSTALPMTAKSAQQLNLSEATNLANHGWTATRLLQKFFPGANLGLDQQSLPPS